MYYVASCGRFLAAGGLLGRFVSLSWGKPLHPQCVNLDHSCNIAGACLHLCRWITSEKGLRIQCILISLILFPLRPVLPTLFHIHIYYSPILFCTLLPDLVSIASPVHAEKLHFLLAHLLCALPQSIL